MRCCVLVTGMPATGKTTFADNLSRQLSLPMISKDGIKEKLYDTIGFRNSAEKVAISISATQLLYYYAESLMRGEITFILENNFENVMKPSLISLLEQYHYHTLTVRFVGDVNIIYQRYLERNRDDHRHGGHKTKEAWPEMGNLPMLSGAPPMEEFISAVNLRGIAEFSVGGMELCVDTTDFSRVSYTGLIDEVKKILREMGN